ncbi:MAG: leucine-rich repeat protein, partial [Lachnospiraceae bacterium]|nr:leucine-rich repeat protein [Lachnospiraceae bacterium]
GCSSLETITIPDNVESLGLNAFYGCSSLASVIINNSDTVINFGSFYNCPALVDVYYSGSETDWGNISIEGYNTYLTSAFIHYNSISAHTYEYTTSFAWSTDYLSCTVTVGCPVCNSTKTLNCSVSSTDAAKEVLYTAKATIGTVTYSDTQTVSKTPITTPTVTTSEVTANSITVTALDDQSTYGVAVYSIDGTTWQESNVFNNLSAGKSYTVYAKYSGTSTYAESEAGSKSVTTNSIIIWVDADGTTVLETDDSVAYGTMPSYDREEKPTKATDGTYVYTFSSWSPEVSAVTTNTTYTAVYSKTYVAPAAGAGYTIDYSAETATAESGYEISTNGSTWSSGTLTVTPGGMLYVYRAADTEANASATTENTLAFRPDAPGVTAVDEVWYGESDGQITGVTTAMEYSADGSAWTACTGTTVDALAAGTYYVRYRATDSAFAGTAATVVIGSGTERTYTLTVADLTFDDVTYGYSQPDAKAITITSNGNSDATISDVAVDSAIFTIDGSGSTVTAGGSIDTWTIQPAANLNAGIYSDTITVTYNGGATATADVSFTVNKAEQSISYSEGRVFVHINDAAFTNTLTQTTVGGTISYVSNNTDVAAVNENNGEVTIVGAGAATITATAAETNNYEEATAAYTLTVTGHSYEAVVTEPICTEGGYTMHTCSVCGDSYVDSKTEATGHSWNEGEVTTEATCITDGVKTYTCTVCGETKTEAVSATGHTSGAAVKENEVAATCTVDGSYDSVVYCTDCGEELSRETVTVSATGHSYASVVTEPTCTEKGYTTYTCTICGDSYTADETDATGHSYEAVVTEPTYTERGYTVYTCTNCGDSYITDYTAIKVIDGTDEDLSTKTTVQELTAVPEGLKSLYSSVKELISDLISRVTVGTGYSADNAIVYDVVLQYSTDGGATWITATVDNFPADGITVTLPYPDGTDSSYEFTVLHMFTVDSDRLGITAGDTESPTVTKTDDALVFTLKGLSPVAVAWKETEEETKTETEIETETETETEIMTETEAETEKEPAPAPSPSGTWKHGLELDPDGVFRYYINNVFAKNYIGVVPYDGSLFFIKNGLIDFDANELCLYEDVWYYVSLGQVQLQYTGLAMHDGAWFYVTDGILDITVNGLIPYDGEQFLVAAGRLVLEYSGLWLNSSGIGGDDGWYFLAAGMVCKVSQVVMYDDAWFVVRNGILATGYNGTIEYGGAVFTVVKGQLYEA